MLSGMIFLTLSEVNMNAEMIKTQDEKLKALYFSTHFLENLSSIWPEISGQKRLANRIESTTQPKYIKTNNATTIYLMDVMFVRNIFMRSKPRKLVTKKPINTFISTNEILYPFFEEKISMFFIQKSLLLVDPGRISLSCPKALPPRFARRNSGTGSSHPLESIYNFNPKFIWLKLSVDPGRIELPASRCKRDVLPLYHGPIFCEL